MSDGPDTTTEGGEILLAEPPDRLTPICLDGRLEQLPLVDMTWENFERLLLRVLHDVECLRGVTIYGTRGQKQHGLDVVGQDALGHLVALQSKRQKQFDQTDLRTAVDKFVEGKRSWETHKFIVAVSCEAHTTEIVDETIAAGIALDPVEFEFWDGNAIGRKLRNQPSIVTEFFGEQAAERFCDPWQRQTVPSADAAAVAEAVARTPLVATGAAGLLEEAEAAAPERPRDALGLIGNAQALLREAGFAGYADALEERRVQLLAASGQWKEASDACLDMFWLALDSTAHHVVHKCRDQIAALVRDSGGDRAVRVAEVVISAAVAVWSDPVGDVSPAFVVPNDVRPVDAGRLLALHGEAALALNRDACLAARRAEFSAAADALGNGLEILATRLRLLAAEGSGDWNALVARARSRRDGYAAAALVHARYARWCANRERFLLADAEWSEAVGDACLARRWSDAVMWVVARRVFAPRWRLPIDDAGLLTLQQSISRLGESVPIAGSGKSHVGACLRDLRHGRFRAAALAGHRALREAVASADWHTEAEARSLLAEILRRSGELGTAALQCVLGADSKGVKALALDAGDEYIDVTALFLAPNYWTSSTAYSLTAAQADLVPDEAVPTVSAAAVGVLGRHATGELTDGPFAPNPLLEAVRVLAGLGERLDPETAETVLAYFEAQPVIHEGQYRFHDDQEATLVARIGGSHTHLTERAIAHLIALCARSYTARRASSVAEAIEIHFDLARARLQALADAGNDWAAQQLAVDSPPPPDAPRVEKAYRRLVSPLKHQPVYSRGGGVVEDSLLLLGLPPHARAQVVHALMDKSRDPHVGSTERGDYLTAAQNLVGNLDEDDRTALFARAMNNSVELAPSAFDEEFRPFAHPLSAVRINLEGDEHTPLLLLAARLAETPDDYDSVRAATMRALAAGNRGAVRVLALLPASPSDVDMFARQPEPAARQIAAIRWSDVQQPVHLGELLARDSDPSVRRALARSLASSPPTETDRPARRLLAVDPRYSVRSLAAGGPV